MRSSTSASVLSDHSSSGAEPSAAESLRCLCNVNKHRWSLRAAPETHIWRARGKTPRAHWRTRAPGPAPRVGWWPSPLPVLGSSRSPPTSPERRHRPDPLHRPSARTYGPTSPLSFFHRCAHYSLKIPPKKRRRFSKTFWPLSHVSTSEAGGKEALPPVELRGFARNMAGWSFCLPATHDRPIHWVGLFHASPRCVSLRRPFPVL